MIVSSIFIAIVIVLEAGPVYILFMSGASGKTVTAFQWLLIIASFLMVVLINILAVFKPMTMVILFVGILYAIPITVLVFY